MSKRVTFFLITLGWWIFLSACSVITTSPRPPVYIDSRATWGILPFSNHTDTPLAGTRATSMVAGILQAYRPGQMVVMSTNASLRTLLSQPDPQEPAWPQVRNWAIKHHIRYVLMGSVNEWQYKVGLDGEPIVSLTMRLVDVSDSRTLWNSVGSKAGNSRSGLANTGQSLMIKMLKDLFVHSHLTR